MPNPELLRRAGASEQQVTVLTDFMFDQQMKRIDLQASAAKAELALDRLMRVPSSEEKAVAEAVDAVNQARGDLFKADIAIPLKLKQVLGEDVLHKLREQGPASRMGRGGDRQGGHRPEGGNEGQRVPPNPPRE